MSAFSPSRRRVEAEKDPRRRRARRGFAEKSNLFWRSQIDHEGAPPKLGWNRAARRRGQYQKVVPIRRVFGRCRRDQQFVWPRVRVERLRGRNQSQPPQTRVQMFLARTEPAAIFAQHQTHLGTLIAEML